MLILYKYIYFSVFSGCAKGTVSVFKKISNCCKPMLFFFKGPLNKHLLSRHCQVATYISEYSEFCYYLVTEK